MCIIKVVFDSFRHFDYIFADSDPEKELGQYATLAGFKLGIKKNPSPELAKDNVHLFAYI